MNRDSRGSGDPLKVGILIPRLSGGGAEFAALQWASYLQRTGHSVTVITTHDRGASLDDLYVIELTAPTFPARIWALRRHVATVDYDVLIGLMPHWNLLVLLAVLGSSKKLPAVVISGRNVEAPLRRIIGWSYRVELTLCHLLYRRANGYIAVSHPVAAEAAASYGLDPARVWVVPSPSTGKSGGSRFTTRSAPVPHTKSGTVTLTVPARLVRQKRPELAIETAAVLRAEYGIDARVEYFGNGPDEQLVLETAARLDVPVSLRGWVTAWFDEAAADAVVLLPSSAEGFPNVVVEAVAAGIPSVASSRALGVADAIIPNVTGILTMTSEPKEFAAAVRQAMLLAPVSVPQWLERFSPEESGRKLVQVLRSVTA